MVKFIRWILLSVFFCSVVVLLLVHPSVSTPATIENGKYVIFYRSTRYEVSRQEYETLRAETQADSRQNAVMMLATATMMISLFFFVGFDRILHRPPK